MARTVWRGLALALLAGSAFLFLYRLGDRDLWNSHEARAAMDAQSLLTGADWRLPHLYDGRPELQKPPLYYWLVALTAKLRATPVDAWATRLPAALAALLCVGLLILLGRLLECPAVGLLAGLILATAIHFTWLARVARIDMPLTATTTLALGAMYLARQTTSRGWRTGLHLSGYGALAAAFFLKGPIGMVLPVAVWGAILLVEGEVPAPWRVRAWGELLQRQGVWWGAALVLLLVGPWCWWVQQHTEGAWFREFIWYHTVERGLGGSRLRAHPWWFYVPQGALDFLPWSLLFLPLLWWWLRTGGWRDDPVGRFGLLWMLTVASVLSLSRFKRADYLVPAYPGAALFLGASLWRLRQRVASGWTEARVAWLGAGGLAVAMVAWWGRITLVQPGVEPRLEQRTLACAIHARSPQLREVVFFRTESHLLAFHLGRPLTILLNWEDLERWANEPRAEPAYVVMPAAVADECARRLHPRCLERVLSHALLGQPEHEKPLVVMRTLNQDSR